MALDFQNALAGAGTGALLGSQFAPGIGTAIGGVGGGLLGLLGFGGSKPDQFKQLPTYSPEQQQMLRSILSQLGMMGQGEGAYGLAQNRLSSLLSPDSDIYGEFEAPYLRRFNEQTIPGLAERFAGLGAQGGALSSSGFGQSLGAAGAGLQTDLAALRANMQNQALNSAFSQYNNLSQLGLGSRPFENLYQPGSTGLFGNTLSGLAGGIGSGMGLGMGKNLSSSLFG